MNKKKNQGIILALLYLSFISLGLPDAVLGTAWPEMRFSFNKGLEYAGLLVSLTTIISVGSSLSSGYITARWNTGVIITACGFMTASAMYGYSTSQTWFILLLYTALFGIGQGAVDTAVNAYMARHYSARHMNWVHCCWGMGATGGPLIMTLAFSMGHSWRVGYLAIGLIQTVLSLVFFFSRRLWVSGDNSGHQKHAPARAHGQAGATSLTRKQLFKASAAGICFYFLYPGVEAVAGLWGASYFVEIHGATPAAAALGVTIFWTALTAGRFAAGVIATRLSNAALLRGGLLLAAAGALLLIFSADIWLSRFALILVGFSISPLYPTMMHDTPRRLGTGQADRVVGFQVGAALAGTTLVPVLIGFAARHFSLSLFGPALLCFLVLLLLVHEVSFRNSLCGQA